jgi:hypothetical protein
MWWYTLIPAFGRLRQEAVKFQASLGYIALKLKQSQVLVAHTCNPSYW